MIKKILLKVKIFFHYLMRGLNSADKIAFGTKDDVLSSGSENIEKLHKNSVWDNLLNGEITEEVKELRYKTYTVERKSKDYGYIGNGIAAKKNYLSEDHVKVDESDNLPIEIIQDNYLITENVFDSIKDIEEYGYFNKQKYIISVKRDFFPRFKIEEFITKIVVKKVNDKKSQIDLYTSLYPIKENIKHKPFISELYKILNNNAKSDILLFNELKFITYKAYGSNDFLSYTYNNIVFKGILIYDGNFVLKFNADIVENGVDLTKKFFNKQMDSKYKNNDKKNPLMFSCSVDSYNEKLINEKEIKLKNEFDKKT